MRSGRPHAALQMRKDLKHWEEALKLAKQVDPAQLGRGLIEIKHTTDTASPPPSPRVCMSIHPECQSCFDLGRVLVLDDPPAGLHQPRVRRAAGDARRV